jgi:DNA invertase Pin-like site-specific DNA recombinase
MENMMKIGYARVSTQEQNLEMQLDALKEHGCDKIFSEKASGGNTSRPELDRMLEQLRRGDTIVIWKLDRLGRSLKHLIELVSAFDSQGIGLVSLKENIDTTTATGKLVFNIFAALAEFERDIIRERTIAGLVSAKARGKTGGRKKALNDMQVKMLTQMASDKTLSVADICTQLGISKASYYNYLKKA